MEQEFVGHPTSFSGRLEALLVLKDRLKVLFASEVGVSYAALAFEQRTGAGDETKIAVGASQAPPPLASAGIGSHLNENFHPFFLHSLLLGLLL